MGVNFKFSLDMFIKKLFLTNFYDTNLFQNDIYIYMNLCVQIISHKHF